MFQIKYLFKYITLFRIISFIFFAGLCSLRTASYMLRRKYLFKKITLFKIISFIFLAGLRSGVDRSGLIRLEQKTKTLGVIFSKEETIDSVLISVILNPREGRPRLGLSTSLFV